MNIYGLISRVSNVSEKLVSRLSSYTQQINSTASSRIGAFIVTIYIIIAVLSPYIAPTDPYETVESTDGGYAVLESPSLLHPLGTTEFANSVLSQTILSFRTTLMVGLFAAFFIVFIGVNLGLIAGYFGGKVEAAIMSIVDLAYGLPFFPLAIVLIVIFGTSLLNIALVIALVFWREIARVTRAEVLSLKQREFVKASKACGSSDWKIMYSQILPNLVPLILLYVVFGVAWGILLEASLSFLGLGDAQTISWGLMLHRSFESGHFASALWWTLPPAIALSVFIWSLFAIARSLEDTAERRR